MTDISVFQEERTPARSESVREHQNVLIAGSGMVASKVFELDEAIGADRVSERFRSRVQAIVWNLQESQQDIPAGAIDAGRQHDVDVASVKPVRVEQFLNDLPPHQEIRRHDFRRALDRVPIVAARDLAEPNPPVGCTTTLDDDIAGAIADDVVQNLPLASGR